ncbi:MAG: helix-turn-helix transcriptional regulator [Gammaproteobacteria bacterium]|nr:helix-turn-helix transcriptional regulator [Gammaproteobacteria bacterium]
MDHQKLREIRNSKGWTQGYAAKQIGIQQSYLSKLENGQAIPSAEIIKSIAKTYDYKTSDFAPDLIIPETNHPITRSSKLIKISILALLLGLVLIATAWFGIFKSNYAYTYELQHDAQQSTPAPIYFILDEYKGEKYRQSFAENSYTYQLIGERKIHPKINRWIYYFGYICLGIGLIIFFIPLGHKK